MQVPHCTTELHVKYNKNLAKAHRLDRKDAKDSQTENKLRMKEIVTDMAAGFKKPDNAAAVLDAQDANATSTAREQILEVQGYLRGYAYRRDISSTDWEKKPIWATTLPVIQYLFLRCNDKEMAGLAEHAKEHLEERDPKWRTVSAGPPQLTHPRLADDYATRCVEVSRRTSVSASGGRGTSGGCCFSCACNPPRGSIRCSLMTVLDMQCVSPMCITRVREQRMVLHGIVVS